jgi:hypothetical protein
MFGGATTAPRVGHRTRYRTGNDVASSSPAVVIGWCVVWPRRFTALLLSRCDGTDRGRFLCVRELAGHKPIRAALSGSSRPSRSGPEAGVAAKRPSLVQTIFDTKLEPRDDRPASGVSNSVRRSVLAGIQLTPAAPLDEYQVRQTRLLRRLLGYGEAAVCARSTGALGDRPRDTEGASASAPPFTRSRKRSSIHPNPIRVSEPLEFRGEGRRRRSRSPRSGRRARR